MRLPAALLATLVLLAGCSGSPSQEAAPAASTTTAAAGLVPLPDNGTAAAGSGPVALELTGCLRLDTSFPYPIAVFSTLGFQLPEGFAFASGDGQTVQAFLAWWFCSGGQLNDTVNNPFAGAVGSMFASIPVVPPSDLAGKDPGTGEVLLDLVPLTWVLSERLASEHLGRVDGLRGGYVEFGEVVQTATARAVAADVYGATAPASFGKFDVDAAIQPAASASPEGRYRMWLWPDDAPVTSFLDIRLTEGATLGTGAADLRFAGSLDAGAPPATAGLSVVVDQTDLTLVVVDLGPE